MIKRCSGCGAVLQTENSNLVGYVPDLKFKICQRCHKLTNYGEVIYSNVNKDNDKIIDIINKNKKHVFFLIDFLNINDEVINTYKKISSTKNIIITKKDNIPKTTKTTTAIKSKSKDLTFLFFLLVCFPVLLFFFLPNSYTS